MLDHEMENNQDNTEVPHNPDNADGGQNPENIYSAESEESAPQEKINPADEVGNSTVNWTTATPIVAQSRQERQRSAGTGEVQDTNTDIAQNMDTAGEQDSYSASAQNANTSESQGSNTGTVQSGNAEEIRGTYSGAGQGTFSGSTPVSPIPEEPEKKAKAKKAKKHREKKAKEKKPAGIVKRAFAAALCGVLFGGAAAGTFYGIYQLAGGPEIVESIVEAGQSSGTSTVVVSNSDVVNVDDGDSTDTASAGSTWITEVAEAVMPSMVSVTNSYTEQSSYFGYSYTQEVVSAGSGIIIGSNDTELLIATNQHVIDSYKSLSVTFVDGSEVTAYLKGSDTDMDLAVLAVLYEDIDDSTLEEIRIAVLGDSDELVLGQEVVAIGNALGYGQSVTNGIVSALNREIETESGGSSYFIQTNAAVNPGNSGGALLDSYGRVIGIVSAKIGGDTVEGMGFAIPINSAVDIINELSTNTTMIKLSDDEKGYLGVTVLSDSYNTQSQREMYGIPEGAYVRSVEEGGAADNAGIQANDVITAVNGSTVTGYDDLAAILQYYSAGTEVTVTFLRNTDGGWTEMEVTATLGSYPSD
ncbi:MAG: trypsin-like peptidase domain-containing protein [Lachnospiraceae bacterium]|nr:trypsin-like peptidase domain-containing protein [Lachnospiraceae bacterium]